MQYCKQCNVSVSGADDICPLCQQNLTGEKERPLYPKIQTVYKKHQLFFKLLFGGTASAAIISVGINLILSQTGFWSIYVIFGIISFWISLVNVLKRKDNLLKSIAVQAFVLTVLSVILDLIMGWSNWSIDYFIPITYSVELISLYIIAIVKKLPAEEYIVYIITAVILGIIPIIFFLSGILSIVLPTIICTILSLLSIVWLSAFEGKRLIWEIKRRFHL